MKKILVIDDEKEICSYLKECLEEFQYEVFTAHDGNEGLQSFEANNPNLVILDMNMPGMSGMEFYEKLADKGDGEPQVPIIVLTAHREMQFDFGDRKIHSFITKPINLDDFIQVVNRVFSED